MPVTQQKSIRSLGTSRATKSNNLESASYSITVKDHDSRINTSRKINREFDSNNKLPNDHI